MKKWMALLLAVLLLVPIMLHAYAEGNTRVFVDSSGREVVLPEKIERIAVTGPLAQMVVDPNLIASHDPKAHEAVLEVMRGLQVKLL